MKASFYINNCAGRGKGVFTARPFRPGEFILRFGGERVHFRDITDFTHFIQISPDYFLGPTGEADDYVNHSCDPNSGVYMEEGKLVLRALQHISRDEEIVFDYGTIIFSEPTSFQCDCGTSRCRGVIGKFSTLPEDLQVYYQSINLVPLLAGHSDSEIPGRIAAAFA